MYIDTRKEEGKKKQPIKTGSYREMGKRIYALPYMVVTFPTRHAERLQLNKAAK